MKLTRSVFAAMSVAVLLFSANARAQWTFSKTANPSTGAAPLSVVYTYTFDNTHGRFSLFSITTPSDDTCSPVVFSGGDTNHNQILDLGESWTWTCSTVVNATTVNTSQTNAQYTDCQGDDACSLQYVEFITAHATVTIQRLAVSIRGPSSACKGDLVTLTAVPTGGVPPYTFSWTTGETSQAITPNTSTPGTFNFGVTARDSVGSTASASARLSVASVCLPPPPFDPAQLHRPEFPLLTTIEWGCGWSLAGRCLQATIVRICVGGQCINNPTSPLPQFCPRCDLLAGAGGGAALGFVVGALLARRRRRTPTTPSA
jgi:hypothetical protein